MRKHTSRAIRRIFKALAIVILSLTLIIMLTPAVLNVAKFAIYSDYYAIESSLCKNPGLSDGFVCQGIGATDDGEKILVSGYMADGSASRIYVTDTDNNSYYVSIQHGGEYFTGHAGGITVSGDTVYIASGKKINIIPLAAVLDAKCGDTVSITEAIDTNNSASYIFSSDTYLYVGEFHDGKKYVTHHTYDTPDGEQNAIIARYKLSDLSSPDRIYSVRDKVQGAAFTPDGKIIFSTSYGLADSVYYVYDEASLVPSGQEMDGAPVYFVNGAEREIKGPAMAEGLDYLDGKLITLTESASDKYLFGKLFFADKIVTLDYQKQ